MQVGIIGTGALGQALAREVAAGFAPGMRLSGIHGIDQEAARSLAQELKTPVLELDQLVQTSDLLVEATSASAMPGIVRFGLERGKSVLAMSVGGFVMDEGLVHICEQANGKVLVPSGGIAGIDGLLALREHGLDEVGITTIKSPGSLAGAPYFAASGLDPLNLAKKTTVFSGSAREAIAAFPANVNLAVTVSLAGIGFDRTRIQIVADPGAKRTVQHLRVVAGDCLLDTTISGIPLPQNPRTALVALMSARALLRKSGAHLQLGT